MKRGSKVSLIVFGGITFLCVGVFSAAWFSLTSGADSLGTGLAAYHKAGLPWTAAELQPPIPAEQDGGPILLRAFAALDRDRAANAEQSASTEIENGDYASADAQLTPFKNVLALVGQAVEKPHAVIPKDWDLGPLVEFPEYSYSKIVVKLLCDRARVRALNGDVAGSCDDTRVAGRLADRMSEEPLMIGAWASLSERAIVLHTLERCAATYSGQAGREQSLKAVLDGMSDTPNLVNAGRGEAYLNLALLRNYSLLRSRVNIASDSAFSALPPVDTKKLVRSGDPSGFEVELFGGPVLLNEVRFAEIDEADQNDPKKLKEDEQALDVSIASHHALRNYLADRLLPVFSQIGIQVEEDHAQVETMKALLEAELIKANTGHFPQSISELPTKWIDPCNGKPLRMITGPASIRIYSVGHDGHDDGGISQYEVHPMNRYDVVAADPPTNRKSVASTAAKKIR